MTEDAPKKASGRYISAYLKQPLRSVTEAQKDRAAYQSEPVAEEKKPKPIT